MSTDTTIAQQAPRRGAIIIRGQSTTTSGNGDTLAECTITVVIYFSAGSGLRSAFIHQIVGRI